MRAALLFCYSEACRSSCEDRSRGAVADHNETRTRDLRVLLQPRTVVGLRAPDMLLASTRPEQRDHDAAGENTHLPSHENVRAGSSSDLPRCAQLVRHRQTPGLPLRGVEPSQPALQRATQDGAAEAQDPESVHHHQQDLLPGLGVLLGRL